MLQGDPLNVCSVKLELLILTSFDQFCFVCLGYTPQYCPSVLQNMLTMCKEFPFESWASPHQLDHGFFCSETVDIVL